VGKKETAKKSSSYEDNLSEDEDEEDFDEDMLEESDGEASIVPPPRARPRSRLIWTTLILQMMKLKRLLLHWRPRSNTLTMWD
jgi:hypothetical protein